MVNAPPQSGLVTFLANATDSEFVTALVRRVRAWRRVLGDEQDADKRRSQIEKTLTEILKSKPGVRFPLALRADQEEPGPLPRILASLPHLIDPPLAAELLNSLAGMDDRQRPLMLVCTQVLIDAGVEDSETIILHLYSLRDAGDVKTAADLAKMALETSSDADELGRLDSLLAEIAYDEQRYEEALGYWRASIRKDDATSMRLNNCGATLQHLGRHQEAAHSFLEAARVARRGGQDNADDYRSRGSACVNMAMGALERGRTGTALSLARIGTERYRDLLARHPGHSDTDAALLFSPLIVALDEANLPDESQAVAEEVLALARDRYRENPDIGARGLIDAIKILHNNALENGQYTLAQKFSGELRKLAKRHYGQTFGINDEDLALALASEADALFLDGNTQSALQIYDEVEAILDGATIYANPSEVFITHLNHAMALNDIEHRDEAARRLTARLADLEEQAQENGWLWVLVARGYSDLAIVESERGREAASLEAIKASMLAVKQVRAGGRNQWVNSAEQTIAIANSLSHLGSYADAIEMLQLLVNELEQRLEESEDQGVKLLLFETFNDLGLIAHAAARHDEAEDAYGQALALGASADPNSVLSHRMARMLVNRAAALTEAHQFDRALKSLERAEALISPSDGVWTDYLNNRAAVLIGLGKTTEALRFFKDAYDAADDNEDRHRAALNIAVSLVDLERWAEARDTAHQVISETKGAVFDPEGVDAVTLYFWIASCIIASRAAAFVCAPDQALQETTEALAALEGISAHLGPDRVQLHGYALEAVGDAFAAVGDRQSAEQNWSDAEDRFETFQSRLWQKEIARLQQKRGHS